MITRVRIRNFKSLQDVTVDLDDVTVLVGRGGSGKSNFVEALRFLRDLLTQRGTHFLSNQGGWGRIQPAHLAEPGRLEIEVDLSVSGVDGSYTYLVAFSGRWAHSDSAISLAEERLTLNGKVLFHTEDGRWIVTPPVSSVSPGELVLGGLSGMSEVTIAHLALTAGLGCYDFPGDVLKNSKGAQRTGLVDDGSNFLEAFAAIESNLQALANWRQLVAALRVFSPSVSNVETRKPQRDQIAISHSLGGALLVMNLDQESEGLRRFLAYLIALYQSPAKQTLLFEEPEKGIHPGALESLAEQFLMCPKANRGQVILTTHSPQLLNCIPAEHIRVVEIHDHATRIGHVAPDQLDAIRENLLTTGELLTVTPARIDAAPVETGP